jgi:hypothetical protein
MNKRIGIGIVIGLLLTGGVGVLFWQASGPREPVLRDGL